MLRWRHFSRIPSRSLKLRRSGVPAQPRFSAAGAAGTGFGIPRTPEGAFYIYADASRFTQDGQIFAHDLLDQAGVVVTPGIDFGAHHARQHVRFAYSSALPRLEEGVERLRRYCKFLGRVAG